MNNNLRFKDQNGHLYEDWVKKDLSEIVERIIEKNKDEQTLRTLTISGSQGLVDQLEYFTKKISSPNIGGYTLLKEGEFAYNKSYSKGSPLGATKRLNKYDMGAVSPLYICFRLKTNAVCSDYLEQVFETPAWNDQLKTIAAEGARNHGLLNVSPIDFFTLQLTLPSLPEQQKIAAFLTALDDRIQLQSTKVDLLTQQKQGYSQKIFSRELVFKDDNGDSYEGWRDYSASELFDSISKRNKPNLPILSATQDNGIVFRDNLGKQISYDKENVGQYKLVEPNNFVISLRSFQGGLEMSKITGIISPAYTIIKGSSKCLPTYFKHFFKSPAFIKSLATSLTGIRDGKQVSYQVFGQLPLSLPSVSEQEKIANFLSALDDCIELEKERLQLLNEQKQGYMQQLFA